MRLDIGSSYTALVDLCLSVVFPTTSPMASRGSLRTQVASFKI